MVEPLRLEYKFKLYFIIFELYFGTIFFRVTSTHQVNNKHIL
jgi:hypothetical protein